MLRCIFKPFFKALSGVFSGSADHGFANGALASLGTRVA